MGRAWRAQQLLTKRRGNGGCVQGGNIAKVALWSSSQKRNGKFEVNELNNGEAAHGFIRLSWLP